MDLLHNGYCYEKQGLDSFDLSTKSEFEETSKTR